MEYTIRFRTCRADGKTALIVEDQDGTAYLLGGGVLQCALHRPQGAARLATLLATGAAWYPVPAVSPYTLPELCALVNPTSTLRHAA